MRDLAEKYFGGWQSMSSLPQAGTASETEALPRPPGVQRHFEQGSKAGPLLMQAYYRPSMTSKDSVLFDIIWYVTGVCKHSFATSMTRFTQQKVMWKISAFASTVSFPCCKPLQSIWNKCVMFVSVAYKLCCYGMLKFSPMIQRLKHVKKSKPLTK